MYFVNGSDVSEEPATIISGDRGRGLIETLIGLPIYESTRRHI